MGWALFFAGRVHREKDQVLGKVSAGQIKKAIVAAIMVASIVKSSLWVGQTLGAIHIQLESATSRMSALPISFMVQSSGVHGHCGTRDIKRT
jgi:hypothetical protein